MEEAPSTDSLQVTVAFDRHERSAAQWAAMHRAPLLLRPVVLIPATGVGGMLLGWAQGALERVLHSGGSSLAGMLVPGLLAIAFFIYTIKLVKGRGEENERHERNPDVYTLNDAGLEISGVDDLTLLLWSNMTRVHETKRFFLFVAGSDVQYLPRRALDATQEAQVRALIARHAPAAVRALPAPPRP